MLHSSSDYDLSCFFHIKENTCNVSLLNILFDLDLFYKDFFEVKEVAFCGGLYYVSLIKLELCSPECIVFFFFIVLR